MPGVIPSTSAEALEEGLIRRIRGIVPTATKYNDQPWTPELENRERPTSLQCRAFTVSLAPVGDVEGGLTGNADVETEVVVTVRVHYRTVLGEDLGTVVAHDSQDLHDRLEDSLHPAVTGMTRLEYVGDEPDGDEEEQQVVAYTFAVFYMRPRRTT
jgi:hypothetical protein